jgi:hypothetical protein
MTSWLWLCAPAIGLAIWALRRTRTDGSDLGTLSAQWLHEHRQAAQQEA